MSVDLRLYALVDPDRSGGRRLDDIARDVVAGGATLVQLRDKTGSTLRQIEEARAIKAALAGTFVPFLINDRVDVAHGVLTGILELEHLHIDALKALHQFLELGIAGAALAAAEE